MQNQFSFLNAYSKHVGEPHVISREPLTLGVDLDHGRQVTLTLEGERAKIDFHDSLVHVLADFMNEKVEYTYGAALLIAVRKLVTKASEV